MKIYSLIILQNLFTENNLQYKNFYEFLNLFYIVMRIFKYCN